MFELLSILPLSFWAVIALLVGGGLWSFRRVNDGTGLPALAVLGTTAAWYVGDAFYNDYANHHAKLFTAGTLAGAWWQVAWFLVLFLMLVPPVHRWINRSGQNRRSGVLQLFNHGVDQPEIQKQLNVLFAGCAAVWLVLFLVALLILKGETINYLFPFWDGYRAYPWAHGRIGVGFDAFSVVAVYLQLLTASMFGVVAALATDRRIRRNAIIFCLLAWPFFIFDRTRNIMLAMVVPAMLSWVFLRLRGGMWKKALVLLLLFCAVNAWMKFVIANRSDMGITEAFKQKGLNLSGQKKVHNEGLNMFEELCWVSTFIDNGKYRVNWGARYFAELVNPIPRGLWPGKPMIGLDYAIARGHGQADDTQGGVNTTISTGFIGQGVVNFGRLLGPIAVAFLMSVWVAVLARLDLNVHALGRLPLYSLGLILTFNLGRDITLITLYPFVFGALVIWWFDRHSPKSAKVAPTTARTPNGAHRQPLPFARRTNAGGFVKQSSIRRAPNEPPTDLKNRPVN